MHQKPSFLYSLKTKIDIIRSLYYRLEKNITQMDGKKTKRERDSEPLEFFSRLTAKVITNIITRSSIKAVTPTQSPKVLPKTRLQEEKKHFQEITDSYLRDLEAKEAQARLFTEAFNEHTIISAEESYDRAYLDIKKILSSEPLARKIFQTEEIEKITEIITEAEQLRVTINRELEKKALSAMFAREAKKMLILKRSTFLKELERKEYLLLLKSARFNQTPYDEKMKEAATAALNLTDTLQKIRKSFIECDIDIIQFKTQYKDAIVKAMPILEKHRGWKPLLYNLLNTIAFITTFSLSYWIRNTFFLFKAPTDSAKKAQDVQNCLAQLPVSK